MVASLTPINDIPKITLKNFVLPVLDQQKEFTYEDARVSVILPTYSPRLLTLTLVEDLVRYNPRLHVYVVDDSTPKDDRESATVFQSITALAPSVTLLRTPTNKLKAGALNYALAFMRAREKGGNTDIVITLDDDVMLGERTVENLVRELMSDERLGAACSQCAVYNKNTNMLTRLQALEYVGFNAIRLADQGFIRGPLVMHGMLTAFRGSALREIGYFAEGHLIEDYEITTRFKARGWYVKAAQHAHAWTVVPETLAELWKQRTRWSYGGITVVARTSDYKTVFQDVLGHAVFLSTVAMVLVLCLSGGGARVPAYITSGIIGLSFAQLIVWYGFQLWLMQTYREKDRFDWFLRASIVPEFLYSYLMTLVLLGSYAFFTFNLLKAALVRRGGTIGRLLASRLGRIFEWIGYTESRWGTRIIKI